MRDTAKVGHSGNIVETNNLANFSYGGSWGLSKSIVAPDTLIQA